MILIINRVDAISFCVKEFEIKSLVCSEFVYKTDQLCTMNLISVPDKLFPEIKKIKEAENFK